jgi:hypothetical protein
VGELQRLKAQTHTTVAHRRLKAQFREGVKLGTFELELSEDSTLKFRITQQKIPTET